MKASCVKDNLAKALGVVSRLAGSASTLPVLANVLITTDKNRLKLSTTNLEMGINFWVGAKVIKPGAVTVPARLFHDLVANLDAGTINLEVAENNLKISTSHHQANLNGINPEEFPTIPTLKPKTSFSLPSEQLREALGQVVLVASTDDARPVLNGVYLHSEAKKLYFAATDSYRLAEKTLELKNPPADKIAIIVPARTMQELLRISEGESQNVEISLDENQALFKFDNIELISRLIDGQFPNYRELIPKTAISTATLPVPEFASLAKIAGLFSYSNAGSVNVSIDSKQKLLRLRSVASQVGENTSEAKVAVTGEDAEVNLNSRYLNEALGVIDSEKVDFSITGKINPCLLRPSDKQDYLHIIMPLRA